MPQVCLDLGSELLRAGMSGGVTELRPSGRPVRRGVVVDVEALHRALPVLVGRLRGQDLVMSTPAGASGDEVRSSLEATARSVRARTFTAVPAPTAAMRGVGAKGSALVVDLGAELTEISWVESSGFQIGATLPWGVRDLRLALWEHLQDRHGVTFSPVALGGHWAGGTVASRCRTSHATRIIRVTADDVDHVIAEGRDQIRRVVERLERASQRHHAQHLLVGGGALLPDLRRRLLPAGVRWQVPPNPAHAVVVGLTAA